MNENEISQIGVLLFFLGYALLAVKYIFHFKQLQKAYADTGLEWPSLTREQILTYGIIKGLQKTFASTFKIWSIILFVRPSNSTVRKPLKDVRFTLLLFISFPFVLGLLLLLSMTFIGNI